MARCYGSRKSSHCIHHSFHALMIFQANSTLCIHRLTPADQAESDNCLYVTRNILTDNCDVCTSSRRPRCDHLEQSVLRLSNLPSPRSDLLLSLEDLPLPFPRHPPRPCHTYTGSTTNRSFEQRDKKPDLNICIVLFVDQSLH